MRLSARLLVHAIWLGGIILTIALGAAAREVLKAQGVSVVSVEEGLKLLLPYALWADAPFIALALLVRWRLRKTLAEYPDDFGRMMHMAFGSFVGTAVVHGMMQFQSMTYSGPGGFAEVVAMAIVLSIMTIPAMILTCSVGAAIGGLLGALVHRLRFGPPPSRPA